MFTIIPMHLTEVQNRSVEYSQARTHHYYSAACWRVKIRPSNRKLIRSKPMKPPRSCVCKGIRKHINPLLVLMWGSRYWWDIIDGESARVDEPRSLQILTADSEELHTTHPHAERRTLQTDVSQTLQTALINRQSKKNMTVLLQICIITTPSQMNVPIFCYVKLDTTVQH